MLKQKHLSPWLLIYLISSLLLFLTSIGIIVIAIINEINGFNFISVQFLTCPVSINFKFNFSMEIVLKICFVLAIAGVVFALGQVVIVLWQFVVFRKWSQQNQSDEEKPFEELTFKKLICLYILNFFGFLSLVPVVGTFLSYFIELAKCSDPQNKSSTYFIPIIVAGAALLFQILTFCILLKLIYHMNDEQNDEKHEETDEVKKMREIEQMQQIKRRILESRGDLAMKNESKHEQNQFYSNSTQQESPKQNENSLLNKNPHRIYDKDNSTIYGSQGKYNNELYATNPGNKDDQKSKQDQRNLMRPSSNLNSPQLSPNSISERQKQVMKTLPKHPYKKNMHQKLKTSDVIFEQPISEQEGSQYNQLPNQYNVPNESNTNIQLNQSNNKQSKGNNNLNQTNKPISISPSLNQSQSSSEALRSKYFNSPYLKHLQNKNVTPEERRQIKRPFLKLSTNVVEFDANNYEIDDLMDDFNTAALDKFDRKKSKSKNETHSVNDSKLLNVPQNKNFNVEKKQGSLNQSNVSVDLADSNVSQRKLQTSRSTAYIREQSILQAEKLQNENPIMGYINEDESYQNQLTKILEFQKLGKKRRRNIYNPFQTYGQTKQTQSKLYLHKNKMDGYSKGLSLPQHEQVLGYDPFRDEALEEQFTTQRGLLLDDDMSNSAGKSGNKNQKKSSKEQTPAQVKKNSRKDGMLLDFIRSKHVMD